jgi:hypothetical protein
MAALFDHHTIKRLSADATAHMATSETVRLSESPVSQSRFACQWHKEKSGRLTCSWRLASPREPGLLP